MEQNLLERVPRQIAPQLQRATGPDWDGGDEQDAHLPTGVIWADRLIFSLNAIFLIKMWINI